MDRAENRQESGDYKDLVNSHRLESDTVSFWKHCPGSVAALYYESAARPGLEEGII